MRFINCIDAVINIQMLPEAIKRPMTTYGSRFAKRERDVQADDSPSSSDSEINDDKIAMMVGDKGDNFFKPVRGEPGISYKVAGG